MSKSHLPIKRIISLYTKRQMTQAGIAERYNVSRNVIRALLKKNGVPSNTSPKKIMLPENKIVKDYVEKRQDVKQLAKHYNVSTTKIHKILWDHNIPAHPPKLKHDYDQMFFDCESYEKYYLFGFCLGDGCLVKPPNKQSHYLTITLNRRDISVLKNFCDWVGMKHNAIKRYPPNYIRLNMCGAVWQKDWSKLGLVPRKTNNPSKLNVPDAFVKAFILGLIDADGSISFAVKRKNKTGKIRKEYGINVVGHPKNMDWILSQLRKIGFNGNVNEHMVKGKWKRIRVQKANDVLELARILDLDKHYDMVLKRKWKALHKAACVDGITNLLTRRVHDRFTIKQVKTIRKKHLTGKFTTGQLANQYDVSQSCIWNVVNYRTHKNI